MGRRFDVLVVVDLSRLSRSQDLAPLLSRFRHRGVRVIGVRDGFDSEARTARMQAGLSGLMSEEFRAMIADRTHAALESRAKGRRPTGGRAYGYVGREIIPEQGQSYTMYSSASPAALGCARLLPSSLPAGPRTRLRVEAYEAPCRWLPAPQRLPKSRAIRR